MMSEFPSFSGGSQSNSTSHDETCEMTGRPGCEGVSKKNKRFYMIQMISIYLLFTLINKPSTKTYTYMYNILTSHHYSGICWRFSSLVPGCAFVYTIIICLGGGDDKGSNSILTKCGLHSLSVRDQLLVLEPGHTDGGGTGHMTGQGNLISRLVVPVM